MRTSVIGLGKLGACLAVSLASKGLETTCLDINKELVEAINTGRATVTEPGLQELLTAHRNRIRATTDYREVIERSEITFLVTPTPSDTDGNFSDRYLQDALRSLAGAFKESKKDYHLFVVTSTVSPGTTSANLIPLIEQYSGRKLNQGFGVCYSPEFIALGSVIRDFLNPDLLLIGESNSHAGDILTGVYEVTCENEPYVARMSIVSAEIVKLSLNSYITMKISFANTLASICQAIPDADIDAISQALGADKRISPYYIRGGLAYGGPCFPRDNKAFAAFARKFGYEALLAEATDKVNKTQIQHLKDLILKHLPGDKRVSIVGLAYKLNTPVIEESAAMHVIRELLQYDAKITVFDPLARQNATSTFGDTIDYATSLKECLSGSSCWILTLPYPELKDIDDSFFTRSPTTIIDCWRIIDPMKFGKQIDYVPLGKSN